MAHLLQGLHLVFLPNSHSVKYLICPGDLKGLHIVLCISVNVKQSKTDEIPEIKIIKGLHKRTQNR